MEEEDTIDEDFPFEDEDFMVDPMGEDEEWDGRREAYRMFADKLWDKAKNEDEQEFRGRDGHHGH